MDTVVTPSFGMPSKRRATAVTERRARLSIGTTFDTIVTDPTATHIWITSQCIALTFK